MRRKMRRYHLHYAGESERRLTTRAVQRWFGDLVTSAGLPKSKAHCHAARHGFATRLLFEGHTPGSLYTLSRLLATVLSA